MVTEKDLQSIENISDCFINLMLLFDKKYKQLSSKQRFQIRAKSTYYQTLLRLISETNQLKSSTTIHNNQLEELRRKTNNLLRLADEMGITDNQLLNTIQANINFNS